MSKTELERYAESAEESLNTAVQSIRSSNPDLPSASESVHNFVVSLLKGFLTDPIGPALNVPAALPSCPRSLFHDQGLVAVGAHSASDWLPNGRHSTIYVERDQLLSSSKRASTAKPNVMAFLDLFNETYATLFGRQDTLVHGLLKGLRDHGAVLKIACRKGNADSDMISCPSTNESLPLFNVSFDRAWDLIADDTSLSKLVSVLWTESAKIDDTVSCLTQQQVRFLAGRLVTLMKDETNADKPWYCIYHTLERNARRASDLRELDTDTFLHKLSSQLFAQPLENGHNRFDEAVRLIRRFQLFLLYRDFCGDWFYVLVPPSAKKKLSMCFTLGTTRELNGGLVAHLWKFVNTLQGCLGDHLHDLYEDSHDRSDYGWSDLAVVLGPEAETLKAQIPKLATDREPALRGLVRYLAFARRISELAIHEGKKLRFDILVSGGACASRLLSPLSNLPMLPKNDTWQVTPECDVTRPRPMPNENAISVILGNYAFLQEPGVVLLGCPEGRLLQVAKLLGPKRSPECVTDEADCYLLQVRDNGDICVFFDGKLCIWRRAGEYHVPRLYGAAYQSALVKWMQDTFSEEVSPDVKFPVLAEVIWSLSADRLGGGTFVLGWSDSRTYPIGKHCYELSRPFQHAVDLPLVSPGSEDVLKRLAVQDGAVIVDLRSGKVFGRQQLVVGKVVWEDFHDAWEKAGWKDWQKVYRWGTRHRSALSLAIEASRAEAKPAAAAITVSSDGDIHVFCGCMPVAQLTYP